MSESLTPEFLVNPRCSPVAIPVGAGVARKAGVSERVKNFSTTKTKIGDNPDSSSEVDGEREVHPTRVRGGTLWFLCPAWLLCPHFVS